MSRNDLYSLLLELSETVGGNQVQIDYDWRFRDIDH